jgi:SAM-dependent methyltransferase
LSGAGCSGVIRWFGRRSKTNVRFQEGAIRLTLLEEYEKQNTWRAWERYLDKLPLKPDQTVYDLGCSVGAVTKLLARRVKKAVGIDFDSLLLNEAKRDKPPNCDFVRENILLADPARFGLCDGIWASFTLAYMRDPSVFVSDWLTCLRDGGWLAVADIDGLFSSHLSKNSRFYDDVAAFEKLSERSRVYDFRIGRKIKSLMTQNGLDIVVQEDDWYDRELNFIGPAPAEIVANWEARLERMVSLKTHLGARYGDFCREFLETITDAAHEAHGGVRFCVGVKA